MFGVLVTTSYVNEQALEEIKEDLKKHNILVWKIGCPIPCKIQPNV